MTNKLIKETIILPKKDRFTETINASSEDISKLYKLTLLYNLSMHFEKKLFKMDKEKEFLKDQTYKNLIKTVRCEYNFTDLSNLNKNDLKIDFGVLTIDGIKINVRNILRSKGDTISEVTDVDKEVYALCRKYDGGGEPKIQRVFEKLIEAYWVFLDF